MRRAFLPGAVVSALLFGATQAAAAQPTPLFNATDLSGWTAASAAGEGTWRVRNGLLAARSGVLLTTETHGRFVLTVEWRFVPGATATTASTASAGILLRTTVAKGEPAGGLRVQLQIGAAGAVYGFAGTKVETNPAPKVAHASAGDAEVSAVSPDANAELPIGQWNRGEIKLDGDKLVVNVNGQKVNDVRVTELGDGPIGLQAAGSEIEIRRIEIKPLQ